MPATELDALFANNNISARYWRNQIAHNFGPSNVKSVVQHSGVLNGKIHEFLKTYTSQVLRYLSTTYAHLSLVERLNSHNYRVVMDGYDCIASRI